MNSTEIFSIALGLAHPWKISDVRFESASEVEGELHIYLDFERGSKFSSRTGEQTTAYDTEEKRWQHLNFFQHRCYLHARVPRLQDGSGKVYHLEVPWARAGSGFTLMFEAYAMLLIAYEMPVCNVAETLEVTQPRVWRVFDYWIFDYWIKKAVSKDDLSEVKRVGVDETSRRKGHDYITQFVDLDKSRTIFVTEGKDAATVENFVEALENKKGKKENIELVSMDMSPAFISGVMEQLPKSQIVFDKFHLVKLLNEALDEVRPLERKGNEQLKNHRYTILRKYENLSLKKKYELDALLPLYPKLGEAYRLRQLFLDVFDVSDAEEAKGYLWFWCDQALEAAIEPFRKFTNTIKAHWWGIVAYFDKRVTNGILEGINAKIQLAKRRARGYRNTQNFMNMVYFLCAKLKFEYPYKTL
jgi:transposase